MQMEELQAWLRARLPSALAASPPQITLYPDEIVIVLSPRVDAPVDEGGGQTELEQALIAQQRELTRPLRMKIAEELQAMLRLPVAWGMRIGGSEVLFTSRSAPVMTRLGRAEREVLDTLVAAGVAETRSSALAYTVRAFAAEHAEWLAEVRQAIEQVRRVRSRLKPSRRSGAPRVPRTDEEMEGREEEAS